MANQLQSNKATSVKFTDTEPNYKIVAAIHATIIQVQIMRDITILRQCHF